MLNLQEINSGSLGTVTNDGIITVLSGGWVALPTTDITTQNNGQITSQDGSILNVNNLVVGRPGLVDDARDNVYGQFSGAVIAAGDITVNTKGGEVVFARAVQATNLNAQSNVTIQGPPAITGTMTIGDPLRLTPQIAQVTFDPVNGDISGTIGAIENLNVLRAQATGGGTVTDLGTVRVGSSNGLGQIQVGAGAALKIGAFDNHAMVSVDGQLVLTNSNAVPSTTNGLAIGAAGQLDIQDGALIINYADPNNSPIDQVNGGGQLDIKDGALIINYADPNNSPIDQVNAWVNSGVNLTNGYFDGPGITSSTAANDPEGLHTVGVVDNQAFGYVEFHGTALPDNTQSILVGYTLFGDANMDGVVNYLDYSLIDAGYTSGATGWINGDFNGDGVVNYLDYSLIDASYTSPDNGVGGVQAMPEPATLGLMALGLVAALLRRRRGNR